MVELRPDTLNKDTDNDAISSTQNFTSVRAESPQNAGCRMLRAISEK